MMEDVAFVTHDSDSGVISFTTDSVDDIGTHSITIRGSISVPTDHTLSQYETISHDIQVELIIEESCHSSIL